MAKGDDWPFVVCTFVGVGALLGGFATAWDAGREYGRRELLKQLQEKNLISQPKENPHER